MCRSGISNSIVNNIYNYLMESDSFEKFDSKLEDAKKRSPKTEVDINPYKNICNLILQSEDKSELKFDYIVNNDFENFEGNDIISKCFKKSWGKCFFEQSNKFELYKIYMKSVFSEIKYKRRYNTKEETINE